MSITILDTSIVESDYKQIVPLSGVDYEVALRWNGRDRRWFFSLSAMTGEKIISGQRVVANWPLTYPGKDLPYPPGIIMAMGSEENGTDPGLSELGERVVLMYLEDFDD